MGADKICFYPNGHSVMLCCTFHCFFLYGTGLKLFERLKDLGTSLPRKKTHWSIARVWDTVRSRNYNSVSFYGQGIEMRGDFYLSSDHLYTNGIEDRIFFCCFSYGDINGERAVAGIVTDYRGAGGKME